MSAVNFLYLGMSEDVLLPFQLVEHIDTLYVIDLVQWSYASRKTITSLCAQIVHTMQAGTYVDSLYGHNATCANEPFNACQLPHGPLVLGTETRSGARWEVAFSYNGRQGRLVRFDADFLHEWPAEVRDITHLTALGAFSTEALDQPTLVRMLYERLAPQCTLVLDQLPWTGEAIPRPLRKLLASKSRCNSPLWAAPTETTSKDWLAKLFPAQRDAIRRALRAE